MRVPHISPCFARALAENRVSSGAASAWAALPGRDRKTDLVKKDVRESRD